jgi:hypothetical protein
LSKKLYSIFLRFKNEIFFSDSEKEHASRFCLLQGWLIFLGTTYQKREKYTKGPQNIPKGYKILQMACQHFQLQAPKIYPNWDFWFKIKNSYHLANLIINSSNALAGTRNFETSNFSVLSEPFHTGGYIGRSECNSDSKIHVCTYV